MALYTDVLDGRVDRQFIEQVAPAYREQAWSVCGSKFGPRSLDEELAEDWTIGDTLEDPYALEALEAAAELAYEMG